MDSAAGLAPGEPQSDARETGASARPVFSVPTLNGRHVYLKPLAQEDQRAVRLMDLSAELGVRFRHRGATPGVGQWTQINDGALAQFLVMRSSDNAPIGITAVYNHSFQDQYAFFATAAFGSSGRSPLIVMGAVLMVEYVFKCWPFRKLYLELPEYNLAQFGSGAAHVFMEEGRLREHMYYDGRWWDKLILALYRRTWEERSARMLRASLPRAPRVATISMPDDSRIS